MNLRTIIADDERLARSRLRRLLTQIPDVEILSECASGPQTVEAVRRDAPHLLLLDIEMPGLDGFGVLEALGPRPLPLVVFVTAYDEHALRAFDACALDYLLKPISAERLGRMLARVRERLAAGMPEAASPAEAPRPGRFTIREGGRVCVVTAEEIDWIEAAGNYAILHAGAKNHIVRETMAALEAQLPPAPFLRVSRSTILNLRRVKELADGEALLADGRRLPITRGLREVQKRLRSLRG